MTKPKLQTKTPDKPEFNSLIGTHEELLADRTTTRLAIVEFDVPKVDDFTGGEQVAQYRLIHIEEATGKDYAAAEELRNRIYQARTGSRTAPRQPEDTPLDGLDGDDPTA